MNYSFRASYGYKDRYFIEASGAYNGSERFAENNRMGFFPSFGGAWVVSSEDWMRPLSKILPYLKFRLSYGRVGNDGVISTPRYVYIPKIGNSRNDQFWYRNTVFQWYRGIAGRYISGNTAQHHIATYDYPRTYGYRGPSFGQCW